MTSKQQSKSSHLNGTLDPTQASGRGTIIEYVVLETMGDCVKKEFNYRYDLDSERLGEINVKSSKLYNTDGKRSWHFSVKLREYTPDYYVCVALDEFYGNILHVWEIPGTSNVIGYKKIKVTNTEKGLERFKPYEVDASEYDKVFQGMDITKYKEFSNLKKGDIDIRYKQSKHHVPAEFCMMKSGKKWKPTSRSFSR